MQTEEALHPGHTNEFSNEPPMCKECEGLNCHVQAFFLKVAVQCSITVINTQLFTGTNKM